MSKRRRLRLLRTLGLAMLLGLVIYILASNGAARSAGPLARGLANGRSALGGQSRSRSSKSDDEEDATAAPLPADIFSIPAVASYLAGTPGDVTAAVFDSDDGDTSLYRPGVTEDTASIMKVDILATLLHEAQEQDVSLTDDQQDLAQDMIEESDDDDAQELWDSLGGAPTVASFDDRAGLTDTTPDAAGYWGLSTTTAADQVQLLKTVAYPNDLLDPASQQYELGLMENVDPSQAWGVSAGVAPGVTLAIKNGWLPLDSGGWQVNSLGVVQGDGRDYVIAALSEEQTESEGISAIEGLSTLVWSELAPRHPERTRTAKAA